jgi:hypothetical protein
MAKILSIHPKIFLQAPFYGTCGPMQQRAFFFIGPCRPVTDGLVTTDRPEAFPGAGGPGRGFGINPDISSIS